MGWRFRKSVKIGPGVRLNFGKKGVGMSVGVRGLRYSVGPSGQRLSASIPGTGLSYEQRLGGRTSRPAAIAPPVTIQPSQPGMFASAAEKNFYKGVVAFQAEDWAGGLLALEEASARDTQNASDDFLAGFCALRLGDNAKAIHFFERVVFGQISLPDTWMLRYGLSGLLSISVTPNVSIEATFSSIGVALLLAELYQDNGEIDKAIGLIQGLYEIQPFDPILRLSLIDLYAERGHYEGILHLGRGVTNNDDVTLQTVLYYVAALSRHGDYQMALLVLGEALRRKAGRSPDLLHAGMYGRAMLFEKTGEPKKVRRELEKIYVEDPLFADVAARLGMPR